MDILSNAWTTAKGWASTGLEKVGEWAGQAAGWAIDKGSQAVQGLISKAGEIAPNMLPAATAALAELSYRGTQGSWASVAYPIVLKCEFMDIADILPQEYGFPTNEYRKLAQLTGFCLCKDTHVAFPCTIHEEEAIEQALNSGVFLEWGDRL